MPDLPTLFSDLVRFETELWNAIDARLDAECSLTLGRFEVMQVVHQLGSCRVNDIADELRITWGGASKIVDRLEATATCRRRPHPTDGRSSLIDLTPAGKRLYTKADRIFQRELQDRLSSVVSDRALAQFAATLSRFEKATRTGSADVATA